MDDAIKPRTARSARTLPREYYTEPSIYDEETEKIFSRRWLYAGRLSQIEEAGSYFLHSMEDDSVIVLRDRGGEPRAFHNVCRHRGTRLCDEPEGKLSQSIRCFYHAWTYSLDGRCIGAPNMDDVKGFDRADYSLHPVALAVWEGGLFVNVDPSPEPFATAYAPLIGKFARWRMSELAIARRLTYEVEGNWKLVFQNYSECYHCPSLHPLLNRLTPYRDSANDLMEGPFLGGPMTLAKKGGSMTLSGERCAAPLGDVKGDALNLVYYYTIFPNLLLSLHPDYVLAHQILRDGPTRTRIVCDWLFHPDAMARPDFDPSGAIEFWNLTNMQDWHACRLSQLGISSRAYTPGPYAELESMIAAFDREYLGALGHGRGCDPS